MNNNRYRLVFNKLRGMLMAVAESSACQRKAAGGQSMAPVIDKVPAVVATLRPLAWGLMLALGMVHVASAQIVPDHAAGRGPGVASAPNGVPLVNIHAPSGAGVSHNQYQQFSVDGRGAILNNATGITQTQLGGYVPGNANLGASGPARVILNEVTGVHPSRLNGFVEVAGQRADVVISNGNGISINGGGFINADRATLTTGAPVFGGDGSLAAFRVTRGGIQVEGQGFNGSSLDQVDLIARSVSINGGLWANNANVIAGANQVDYANLGVQLIEGDGSRPTVGIDVSNLGGMYANRIRLIGTEAGVGVRNAGTLAAQAGDFTLDSAGRVSLIGTTSAAQSLQVRGAEGIDNTGTTAARAAMTLASEGAITNTGSLVAGQDLNASGQSIESTGTLAAGIDESGSATQAGSLRLQGMALVSATGRNLAGADMQVDGGTVSLAGSQTQANGGVTLTARTGGMDLSDASVTAGQAMRVQTQGVLQSDRARINAATLDASAQRFSNRAGTLYARQGATVASRGDLDNTGGTIVTDAGDFDVSAAGTLTNADGRVTNAGTGQTTIHAATIVNSNHGGVAGAGSIGGNGAVVIDAAVLSNTGNGQLIAGADMALRIRQQADNSGGQIYTGGQLSATGTQVMWRNDGGSISGKTVRLDGQALSNRQGTVLAEEDLALNVATDIDNASGLLQATGAMSVDAGGTLANDAGRIVNTGTGNTRLAANTIANSNNAMIGGNGDLSLTAQRLANNAGGQLVSGTALDIQIAQSFDNAGGKTYAGTDLALQADTATVNNNGGSLAAGNSATLRASTLDNTAGKILADRDITLQAGALSGAGSIHAGRDLSLSLRSDYLNAIGNLLKAECNLSLSTTGVFTNQGRLQAVGALNLAASRIANQAGAVINSNATTLSATGELANAGRIEGNTLTTTSDALANTGTLIGDAVTVNARAIQNDGAAAIMAATDQLNLYAREQLANTNGATLYSLGDINIAASGERDARGLLMHRTGRVVNDSSTIEGGSGYSVVEIAAQELINQRPEPLVDTDTTVDTKHERKREKYIHCHTMNPYPQMGCTQAVWAGPYKTPVDASFEASQIVSRDDVRKRIVVNIDGVATQIDYNTLSESGGVLAVNYWDGYNRDIHYDPDTEYESRSDAHRGYQRVEIARDTTTTTTTERDANPGLRGASLVSGGDLILANVGTLTNAYSTIASGSSMQIGDQAQSGDVSSGQYGSTNVVNTGRTLYQRTRKDIVSTYAWSRDTDKNVGKVVQPSVVETPVAVGAIGGTIIAGKRITVYGGSIENEDVAKSDPLAGGGSTKLTGDSVTAQGVKRVSLANTPLTLPSNGLFTYHGESGASYLIETDPRFAHYGNFISSDYMLGLLGIDPSMTQKRLGDGFYEQKLIRDQVTELTGRVYLAGHDSAEDQYKALMASGVHAAKQFNILPGMALTDAQMSALTSDIVWLVSEPVTLPDGSTQTVLVPRVYLARANAMNLDASGALIAGSDVELRSANAMKNSGVIDAGSRLSITAAEDLLNRGGTIRSQGVTALSAGRDIVNQSGQISGNKVGLVAGRDIRNETLFDQQGVSHAAGNAKASTSLYGQQAGISSTGDLLMSAGRDVSMTGANLNAGGDAAIVAGRYLTLDTLAGRTEQSVYNSDRHNSADASTQHGVSSIKTAGSLTTSSAGDTTLRGAQVKAGTDLTMIAGGDLTASAVTNERTHDNVARQSRQRQHEDHSRDQSTVGVQISAGNNATLAAVKSADKGGGIDRTDGKGNITLTGATVTAGTDGKGDGALTVVADRDVSVVEARELHDSSLDVRSRSGSVLRRTQTTTRDSVSQDLASGSTLSGGKVVVQAGRDINVVGSNVVSDHGTTLVAKNDVNILAARETTSEGHFKETKKTGLLNGGEVGFTVGTQQQSADAKSTRTTASASTVGAIKGDVTIVAGNHYQQTGSNVLSPDGDISILAKKVDIVEARETASSVEEQKFRQSGLSVAVTNPVVSAVQTAKQLGRAARSTSDGRMQALAGAAGGLAAKNTYDAVKADPKALGGVGISVTLGASKNDSRTTTSSDSAAGSTVRAGKAVRIQATGAGKDSDITIRGSDVKAGGDIRLKADDQVRLLAAENTESMLRKSSSASGGVGISAQVGAKGTSVGVSLSASGGRGRGDGQDVTWTETTVEAGNKLVIESGGDTTIQGARARGKQVIADIGGNLNIESLQDIHNYNTKDQNLGGSVTIGAGLSGSVNVGQQKIDSKYRSVQGQSGILAGDGGFQVNVKGNTDLKGGVIASTGQAVEDGSNRLKTGTLTYSDLANKAEYKASGISLGAGFSTGGSDKDGVGQDQQGRAATGGEKVPGSDLPKTSGGVSATTPIVMGASGKSSSTTESGISGSQIEITDEAGQAKTGKLAAEALGDLNRDVSSDKDTSNALATIFNEKEIKAGFEIVGTLQREMGTFLNNRAKESTQAQKDLDQERAKPEQQQDPTKIRQLTQVIKDNQTWEMGGTGRTVMTAITAGAAGNVTGSSGAMIQSAAAYYLQSLATREVKGIADLLDSEPARAALQGLVACAGAAAQSQSCGAGAAGAAASVVLNNLLDSMSGEKASTLTEEEKQSRRDVVTSIVASATNSLGGDANVAAVAALIETENNAANFVRGTTERVKVAADGAADLLRKPKGGITRQAIEAELANLKLLGASGDLSLQESLNLSSLWMSVIERAAGENLMTPQEILGSKEFMNAAISSMAFSGGGNASVRSPKAGTGPKPPNSPAEPPPIDPTSKIGDVAAQWKDPSVKANQFQINIGGVKFKADPRMDPGGVPVFTGASDQQVKDYAWSLMRSIGAKDFPVAIKRNGVTRFTFKDPETGASINLRNYSKSADSTGAKWTIDINKHPEFKVGSKTDKAELKFR